MTNVLLGGLGLVYHQWDCLNTLTSHAVYRTLLTHGIYLPTSTIIGPWDLLSRLLRILTRILWPWRTVGFISILSIILIRRWVLKQLIKPPEVLLPISPSPRSKVFSRTSSPESSTLFSDSPPSSPSLLAHSELAVPQRSYLDAVVSILSSQLTAALAPFSTCFFSSASAQEAALTHSAFAAQFLPLSLPSAPPPLSKVSSCSSSLTISPRHSRHLSDPSMSCLTHSSSALWLSSSPSQSTKRNRHDKQLLRLLSQTKFAACVGKEILSVMLPHLKKQALQDQEHLFKAGAVVKKGLYIVATGMLSVFSADGKPMNDFFRGDCLGEWSLVDPLHVVSTHPNSCRSVGSTQVYYLSRLFFETLVAQHPLFLYHFVRTVIGRQWRVAAYVLDTFLELPQGSREDKQGAASSAYVMKDLEETEPHPSPSVHTSSSSNSTLFSESSVSQSSSCSDSSFIAFSSFPCFDSSSSFQSQNCAVSPASSSPLSGCPSANDVPHSPPQHSVSSTSSNSTSSIVSFVSPADSGDSSLSRLSSPFSRSTLLSPLQSSLSGESPATVSTQLSLVTVPVRASVNVCISSASTFAPRCDTPLPSAFKGPFSRRKSVSFAKDLPEVHVFSPEATSSILPVAELTSPPEIFLTQNPFQQVQTAFFAAGDVVFQAGEIASCMYVVKSGHLCAYKESSGENAAAHIEPGYVVGGMSFIGLTNRGETVRATQDSVLWVFTAQIVEELLVRNPHELFAVVRAVGRQLAPVVQHFAELGLQTSYHPAGELLFQEGRPAACIFLCISGRVRAFQTTPRRSDQPQRNVLFEFGRGEPFGGLRDLGGRGSFGEDVERYKYSAVCVRDTELVVFSHGTFATLLKESPSVVLAFTQVFTRHFAYLTSRLSSPRLQHSYVTIAVLPVSRSCTKNRRRRAQSLHPSLSVPSLAHLYLGSYGSSPFSDFVTMLQAALSHLGPCLHMNSEKLDLELGEGVANRLHTFLVRTKVLLWLTHQEEDQRFILLEADPASKGITPWTRCCLGQADVVLLVASATDDPSVSEFERDLVWSKVNPLSRSSMNLSMARGTVSDEDEDSSEEEQRRQIADSSDDEEEEQREPDVVGRHKHLILLHRSGSVPKRSVEWLARRPKLLSHHQIRGLPEDHARLARFIAGESIGLVMGGGGSRGLAHLGVIKALEEADIAIDCVGGTSQGAFMAALYAQYLNSQSMEPVVRSFAARFGPLDILREFTLPVLSYFSGKGFSKLVRNSLGADTQIEDLWLRYFCITTNVRKMTMQIHSRGLLWLLVRASMTVVGLFPPIIHQGDVLVDGGYVNNLPVDIMAKHCTTIIGVDVEDKDNSGNANIHDYGDGVSGWWVLLMQLTGWRTAPHFGTMMVWLTFLSHTRQMEVWESSGLIDLYIRPKVESFGLADYGRINQLIETGYRAGKAALARWNHPANRYNVPVVPLRDSELRRVDSMSMLKSTAHRLKQHQAPSRSRIL